MTVRQMGFLVDSSANIAEDDFYTLRESVANALSIAIPTDGTVEVTVVRYGTAPKVIIQPTVVEDSFILSDLIDVVLSMEYEPNPPMLTWLSTATKSFEYSKDFLYDLGVSETGATYQIINGRLPRFLELSNDGKFTASGLIPVGGVNASFDVVATVNGITSTRRYTLTWSNIFNNVTISFKNIWA